MLDHMLDQTILCPCGLRPRIEVAHESLRVHIRHEECFAGPCRMRALAAAYRGAYERMIEGKLK